MGWTGRELDAERQCQAGSHAACGELGRALVDREISDADFQRGLVLLEVACGQNDLPSCTSLGAIYARGDKPAGLARAKDLLGRACESAGAACSELARIVADEDAQEAMRLARRACSLRDGRGCELAGALELARTLGADKARAEEWFARACAYGVASSCRRVGLLALADPARAARGLDMLKRGCDRGDAASCLEAALVFAPLVSARPRCEDADPLAGRACAGADQDGCAIVAACAMKKGGGAPGLEVLRDQCERRGPLACLYWADESSRHRSADPEAIRSAYSLACRSGQRASAVACPRLAQRALEEAKTSLEAARPLELLKTSCERGSGEACRNLAVEYDRGKWVSADAARAAELRARACGLGVSECCVGDAGAANH
jgi:TPR repeat protein